MSPAIFSFKHVAGYYISPTEFLNSNFITLSPFAENRERKLGDVQPSQPILLLRRDFAPDLPCRQAG
jgi:hypothetical protein